MMIARSLPGGKEEANVSTLRLRYRRLIGEVHRNYYETCVYYSVNYAWQLGFMYFIKRYHVYLHAWACSCIGGCCCSFLSSTFPADVRVNHDGLDLSSSGSFPAVNRIDRCADCGGPVTVDRFGIRDSASRILCRIPHVSCMAQENQTVNAKQQYEEQKRRGSVE